VQVAGSYGRGVETYKTVQVVLNSTEVSALYAAANP
jgi:hypothetical protein